MSASRQHAFIMLIMWIRWTIQTALVMWPLSVPARDFAIATAMDVVLETSAAAASRVILSDITAEARVQVAIHDTREIQQIFYVQC